MDAAGGDVGGDQRLDFALGEGLQRAVALTLRTRAVDRGGGGPVAGELLGDAVSAAPCAAEDDRAAGRLDQLGGDLHAAGRFQPPEDVAHLLDVRLHVADLVAHGVALVVAGEHADIAFEGGREEQRLAVFRGAVEQPSHLRQETHVGHAVGLVDHDHLHLVQVDVALVDQVGEAAGAGDEHVHALRERALLRRVADAAVDGDHAAPAGTGKRVEFAPDLVGEFTGRREHEAARTASSRALHLHQQGQAEGQRLAGAGGCAGADVASGDRVRDGRGLYIEGGGEAEFVEQVGEALGDAQAGKRGGQSISYKCPDGARACSLMPHWASASSHGDGDRPPRRSDRGAEQAG